MNTKLIVAVAVVVIIGGAVVVSRYGSDNLAGAGGFDQFGYNDKARIFNGTGSSWCQGKLGWDESVCDSYMSPYGKDKLIMKWTEDWDRGNSEGWSNPPYDKAWTDNEWNGKGVKDGSGAVWHYKIVWVGPELEDSPYWREGGYPIWGQFEVVMDQGQDPNIGPGHTWFAKATPNGYGSPK
jgi:hypothetical protein